MSLIGIKSVFSLNLRRQKFAIVSIALAVAILLAPAVKIKADPSPQAQVTSRDLSEKQRVIHLLNRLGYGPRLGDVERVKHIGIDKYIDEQLYPERINDSAAEARLKRLESLHMTIAQLYASYPVPRVVAAQLGLIRKNQAIDTKGQSKPNMSDATEPQVDDMNAKQKEDIRRQITAYYKDTI